MQISCTCEANLIFFKGFEAGDGMLDNLPLAVRPCGKSPWRQPESCGMEKVVESRTDKFKRAIVLDRQGSYSSRRR